jgi:hypothetical protein
MFKSSVLKKWNLFLGFCQRFVFLTNVIVCQNLLTANFVKDYQSGTFFSS